MIKVAVVEDDRRYADKLKEYLEQYQRESGRKLSVDFFQDGEDIAVDYKARHDIILMDIEMQFMDGMTAAENIRKLDDEVVIIFITNMPQYAIRGYTVGALDYVLKPLDYFSFSQKIDRALNRLEKRKKRYLSISFKGGVKKLDISSICYIEVQNHDLIYHMTDGDYETKGSMRDVEQELSGEPFFRCNKCYLVNLEHVEGLNGSDLLVRKDVIQASRARKKELLNRLNDYLNEVSK